MNTTTRKGIDKPREAKPQYFAVYDVATEAIIQCGRSTSRGKIVAGHGEAVAYSHERINLHKHGIKNKEIVEKPIRTISLNETADYVEFTVPAGGVVVTSGLEQRPAGKIRCARTKRPRKIHIEHPTHYIPPVIIPASE